MDQTIRHDEEATDEEARVLRAIEARIDLINQRLWELGKKKREEEAR